MRAGCYNGQLAYAGETPALPGDPVSTRERRSEMRKKMPYLLALAVLVFYGLHQDFWFWRRADPLILGFIPIGLFYHALYSVAVAGLMWLLVRYCWPGHLAEASESTEPTLPTRSEKPTSP